MLFKNLHAFILHGSRTFIHQPLFINPSIDDDPKNQLTMGSINSMLLTIKIRLQVSSLKVSMVFSQLIPVSNHEPTLCDGTHTLAHKHTCTCEGNTPASVSCSRYTPNDWNPEGSGRHDEEGLGVVGCQQDAFASVYVRKCARGREIFSFWYRMPAESGGRRLLRPKDVLALQIRKSAPKVMRY